MTMRTLAWLLVLMLALAPLASAQDEDSESDKSEENETDSSGAANDEARDAASESENETKDAKENETEDEDEKEDEREEEREDEREEDDDERKVEIDISDDKAEIKLERENGSAEDAVKIAFDASEARLEVKYESENATTESEQKLEARFQQLVEYVDANGNGAYDEGETIASAYRIDTDHEREDDDEHGSVNGSMDWGPITVEDVTTDGVAGKKLSGRAAFAGNATFGLDFYVYGAFTDLGALTLEPTEAKIDILIEGYPYVREDTALALIMKLKSESELKHEDEDDRDNQAGFVANGTTADKAVSLQFTWLENATVDGVDMPVRATILEEKSESKDGESEQKATIALSYPRGNSILHDPVVGASYHTLASSTTTTNPTPGFAPALAVAAAILGSALLMRRKEH